MPLLVHTGQHYDKNLSGNFFLDLGMQEPDYNLNVGSSSHARQTAAIMTGFEDVCVQENPDFVVVVGDVNSTAACAITAKKMNISVAHVEAGLRSRDQTMPEEINRIVTDSISDLFFVTEKSGVDNLIKEGKQAGQIHLVGNLMVDSLLYQLENMDGPAPDNEPADHIVVTLHRPGNVDHKSRLKDLLEVLQNISKHIPVYFPIHPRTKYRIENFKFGNLLDLNNIHLLPPLGYRDFLKLWKNASLVITDSGGLQEETTCLGVPCFTLRQNTERPITIEQGTNQLLSGGKKQILDAFQRFLAGEKKKGKVPDFWDGRSASRIVPLLY